MGNWNLPINVAGAKPLDPIRNFDVATGPYEVDLGDSDLVTKEGGKTQLNIQVAHSASSPFAGARHRVFVHLDTTKDFNKNHLSALLYGVGVPAQFIEGGQVNINQDTFKGKKAFVYVKAPEASKDENGKTVFADVNFIRPETYRELLAAKAAGANGATTAVQVPVQPTAQPTANAAVLAAATGAAPAATPVPAGIPTI